MAIVRELKKEKAALAMKEWQDTKTLPSLNITDKKMRADLQQAFQKAQKEADKDVKAGKVSSSRAIYYSDLLFGMHLYLYLNKQSWFSIRVALNDDFWRYVSLKVIPDVVAIRHGYEKEDRYWKTSRRIWLRALWWYLFLSWQGSEEATLHLLSMERFSTDEMANLIERTGRNGLQVEVCRTIMKLYGQVPSQTLHNFDQKLHVYDRYGSLFRVISKLNTAKSIVLIPEFVEGGIEGYVKSLFAEVDIYF